MTNTIVEELLTTALGLSGPQVLALKVGAILVSDLLKRPQIDPTGGSSILSSTPGRARIAAQGLKGSARLARRIEERVGQLPGVGNVSASPITGRVLVRFDPGQISAEAIAKVVRLSGMALRVSRPDPQYQLDSLEATLA